MRNLESGDSRGELGGGVVLYGSLISATNVFFPRIWVLYPYLS